MTDGDVEIAYRHITEFYRGTNIPELQKWMSDFSTSVSCFIYLVNSFYRLKPGQYVTEFWVKEKILFVVVLRHKHFARKY